MLSDAEQINTMEVNEALLSILLAAAQEESTAKSENIKMYKDGNTKCKMLGLS